MLEKYRYPMALALFAVILPFIGTFFTYVDQQGIVHEPGFYTIIIGEILLLFSGIWLIRKRPSSRVSFEQAKFKRMC